MKQTKEYLFKHRINFHIVASITMVKQFVLQLLGPVQSLRFNLTEVHLEKVSY